MLDVGTALLQAAERSPRAVALVDGELRLTYGEWLKRVGAVAGGLASLGIRHGDPLAIVLQNRWEMATLHWACQLAGIVAVPLNWRLKPDELDYCLGDASAKAVVFQDVSEEAVAGAPTSADIPRIAVGKASGASHAFDYLEEQAPIAPRAGASADDLSLMLYTSGTTGRPKGVPRRHRAERAAALAHVAQNRYGRGEITLGVMPLYHTMGVRSLLSMALVDGCFVCQRRFDPAECLSAIEHEKATNLYLVPTLYHDLLAHERFAGADITSVRKLGFAGASMTDGLLKRLDTAFRPDLFVNHYGSSEIYTFTIEPEAAARPGSAGRAGLNQRIRVVRLGSVHPDDHATIGEEGQIIADLNGDESFEGYWRRPDADAKALHQGWYFTGDTGYFDEDGDLFVTGRVDDMIITGGENVSPVEIESLLSLHPAVAEIAVVGLPDERWGQRITAFVRRSETVSSTDLDDWCRTSDLANFKRPREYIFIEAIPKSPVGKILRRLLVAGDYEEDTQAGS